MTMLIESLSELRLRQKAATVNKGFPYTSAILLTLF